MKLSIRVLSALMALAGLSTVRADVTGSILGVVRDATQGVVPSARIVATNAETNFSKETLSALAALSGVISVKQVKL